MACSTQCEVFIYHDETTLAEHNNLKGNVFLIIPNSLSVNKDAAQQRLDLCRIPGSESSSPLQILNDEIN
jgi:hypothetical protein